MSTMPPGAWLTDHDDVDPDDGRRRRIQAGEVDWEDEDDLNAVVEEETMSAVAEEFMCLRSRYHQMLEVVVDHKLADLRRRVGDLDAVDARDYEANIRATWGLE